MSDVPEDFLRQAASAAAKEQERARALAAVLAQAPDIGVDEALTRFGQALSQTEQELVRSLTLEELAALRSVESKLGLRRSQHVNNYNNINYPILPAGLRFAVGVLSAQLQRRHMRLGSLRPLSRWPLKSKGRWRCRNLRSTSLNDS